MNIINNELYKGNLKKIKSIEIKQKFKALKISVQKRILLEHLNQILGFYDNKDFLLGAKISVKFLPNVNNYLLKVNFSFYSLIKNLIVQEFDCFFNIYKNDLPNLDMILKQSPEIIKFLGNDFLDKTIEKNIKKLNLKKNQWIIETSNEFQKLWLKELYKFRKNKNIRFDVANLVFKENDILEISLNIFTNLDNEKINNELVLINYNLNNPININEIVKLLNKNDFLDLNKIKEYNLLEEEIKNPKLKTKEKLNVKQKLEDLDWVWDLNFANKKMK